MTCIVNQMKHLLNQLGRIGEIVQRLQDYIFDKLGEDALYVESTGDYDRLKEDHRELDGSAMSPELLEGIWSNHNYYRWHYNGDVFPLDTCNGAEKGFIVYLPNGARTFITFQSLTDDIVDYGSVSIWDCLEARIVGICDSFQSASAKEDEDKVRDVMKNEGHYRSKRVDGNNFVIHSDDPISDKQVEDVITCINLVREDMRKQAEEENRTQVNKDKYYGD